MAMSQAQFDRQFSTILPTDFVASIAINGDVKAICLDTTNCVCGALVLSGALAVDPEQVRILPAYERNTIPLAQWLKRARRSLQSARESGEGWVQEEGHKNIRLV